MRQSESRRSSVSILSLFILSLLTCFFLEDSSERTANDCRDSLYLVVVCLRKSRNARGGNQTELSLQAIPWLRDKPCEFHASCCIKRGIEGCVLCSSIFSDGGSRPEIPLVPCILPNFDGEVHPILCEATGKSMRHQRDALVPLHGLKVALPHVRHHEAFSIGIGKGWIHRVYKSKHIPKAR